MLSDSGSGRYGQAVQRRLGIGAAAGGKLGKRKKKASSFSNNAGTAGKMGRY